MINPRELAKEVIEENDDHVVLSLAQALLDALEDIDDANAYLKTFVDAENPDEFVSVYALKAMHRSAELEGALREIRRSADPEPLFYNVEAYEAMENIQSLADAALSTSINARQAQPKEEK
jgi:hypothetical protein